MLLVDDHDVVRLGLRFLLEARLGFEVVDCGFAAEAVARAQSEAFDLVMLDHRLDGTDSLWVLEQLRQRCPTVPVLMISTYVGAEQIRAAMQLGVSGYLPKEASPEQLEEAIDVALGGRGLYLHPVAAAAMRSLPVQSDVGGRLSDLELDVLRMVATGSTNDSIAAALHCTVKTVKTRLTSILRILGLRNRTEAAAWALRTGLVEGLAPARPKPPLWGERRTHGPTNAPVGRQAVPTSSNA